MHPDPNKRYVAEVVFRDNRGIYGVKPMPDLLDWEVRELAERQYGIHKEWIVEVRYVELPQLAPIEEVYGDSYYVDSYCRRFLPGLDESFSERNNIRQIEDTQLL